MVRDKLDAFFKMEDKQSEENVFAMVDGLKCTAYFDTIEQLRKAFTNINNGMHK